MSIFAHIWSSVRDLWQYRHEPERLRVIAEVYWRLLLLLSVLVLTGLIVYAGLKFYAVFSGGEENPLLGSGGGGISLNAAELNETVTQFGARRAQFEFLKKNPPKIADPSR
ncbi:hypothetical protein HY414_01825 [Candidatus Kaiserbacteria bacterium]|nr:hypothetical protein [Candidatus Kaiserbacteria bacterium]